MEIDLRQFLTEKFEQVEQNIQELKRQVSGRYKPLLTVNEAAEFTGRSAYTVRRWIAEGRLKAERVQGTGPRGRMLITREQLHQVLGRGCPSE